MARNYDQDPLTNDDLEDIENFFKAVQEAYDELQESLNFDWESQKGSYTTPVLSLVLIVSRRVKNLVHNEKSSILDSQ